MLSFIKINMFVYAFLGQVLSLNNMYVKVHILQNLCKINVQEKYFFFIKLLCYVNLNTANSAFVFVTATVLVRVDGSKRNCI